MRRLFLVLALGLMSCTTQPVGARCQQDLDCNTESSEVCRLESSPERACDNMTFCVCCPSDRALALTIPACVPRSSAVDAGATADVVMSAPDVVDVATDVAATPDVRDANTADFVDATAADVSAPDVVDATTPDAATADAGKGDAVSDAGGAG